MKRSVFIIITVIGVSAAAAGLGVLIWWLITRGDNVTTVVLEGEGFEGVQYTAALTQIRDVGDMFWWFYPSEASNPTSRPLLLWLDGITGLAPSLLANFAMFGPLDFNLNRRNQSWVEEYNLLFVDAPLGTGFSSTDSKDNLAKNYDDTTDHLLHVLESFYELHEDYQNSALYIFGQGDGAQLALSLASRLTQIEVPFNRRLIGVVLGNPIVSPALTLTKLGFYLEEMGYIDPASRDIVEEFTTEINSLVDAGQLEEAFDKFLSLGEFINEQSGAAAVNMGHILHKLTLDSSRDHFGQREYIRSALQLDLDFNSFMVETVAPALGITTREYDTTREASMQSLRSVFMEPATQIVEYLLENTNLTITIYNGNLDAVSTTPGQLEWVNDLQWHGASDFRSASRQTLVVNGLVEGYFREADRLVFYWMNTAGVSVPLDSPTAMRRALQRITAST